MGSLKPGATYIYERDKGTTYAREFGADPDTRRAIGWDYNYKNKTPKSSGQLDLEEHVLWNEIRQEARNHPALQKAVDNAILVYKMVKNYNE